MPVRLLFVCLGNICRSPLAEAAFRAEADRIGLDVEIDSAGTGDWHVGQPPDPRAQAVARREGVDIGALRARQVTKADFHQFDHVVALDFDILRDLRAIQPESARASLSLLLDHVPGREGQSVSDPYEGGKAHFEKSWADVSEAAKALAKTLASAR